MSVNYQLSAGTIMYIIAIVVIYFINIAAVVAYCRRRNIEACPYVALAVFFTWWVWCCLIPAGNRQQQLVVISTAPQHMQPYVAPGQPFASQPYGQQPYGQQPYGQPAYPQGGAGYAPQQAANPYQQQQQQQAYAANPYGQPPQNTYAQGPNPYAQPPNPYAQPPNPYAQAPNPYASGDIVKPQ